MITYEEKLRRVRRTLKRLKLDVSWFDLVVDDVKRKETNRICNSNRQIQFLLKRGYLAKQLIRMARRYAKMRNKHVIQAYNSTPKKKKRKSKSV